MSPSTAPVITPAKELLLADELGFVEGANLFLREFFETARTCLLNGSVATT